MNRIFLQATSIVLFVLALIGPKAQGQDSPAVSQSTTAAAVEIKWQEPPRVESREITIDFTQRQQIDFAKDTSGVEESIKKILPAGAVRLISANIKVPLQSVEPFLAIASAWRKAGETENLFAMSLRGSADGATWSDWMEVSADEHAVSPNGETFGNLIFLDKRTQHIQYRLILPEMASNVSTVLAKLRLIFISPGATPAEVLGQIKKAKTASDLSQAPMPAYVSRNGWGCPEGQASPRWQPTQTSPSHLIIHHTAGSNTSSDWPAVMRSIWTLHANTNGWGDLGYNWLIDPNGVIYQGRAWWQNADDNVRGAHFCGVAPDPNGINNNEQTMGVALIGTFISSSPSANALNSMASLLAWKSGQRNIDPLGTTLHTPTGLSLKNLSGHKDGCATQCPGDNLHAQLPAIRTNVKNLLNPIVKITFTTVPAGLQIVVDGQAHTTPKTFNWQCNSVHVVTASSPQNGSTGTQYVHSSWSNGQAQTHTITTPCSDATYTANYTTKHYLTMIAGTGGTTSPASNWYNSGVSVPISATPNSEYSFSGWTGTGTVSYTGPNSSATVTMNGPITETAKFTPTPPCYTLTTGANPNGSGSVSITTSQNCTGGYTSGTPIVLTATPGAGYVFNGWAGSGGTFSDISASTTTFTINGNAMVTAYFKTPPPPDFWQSTKGPSGVYAFAFNPTNHVLAGTGDNGIFLSTDNGENWAPSNNGLTTTQVFCFAINASGDIFAGTANGIYRSTNNDSRWTHAGFSNIFIRSLVTNSLDHIFLGSDNGMIGRSTDNGKTWEIFQAGAVGVFALAVNSSGNIFAGTAGDGIFLSTDNGGSWSPINPGLTHKNVRTLVINSKGHIFAGTENGGVFRSTTNGANWVPSNNGLTVLPNMTILDLAINSKDDLFAGTYSGVFQSTNNGDSWTKNNSGLTSTFVRSIGVDLTGYAFAGTDVGVFRSVQSTNPCYSLTTGVNPSGSGTVTVETPSNCSGKYISGTPITLTAKPNSGYIFKDWTGSGGTFENPSAATTTFTIIGAAVVTANFTSDPVIPLPAAAAYGKIPGGDQAHPDKVSYSFAGMAGHVYLSYQVYDVATNEVNVFLNDVKVRNIVPTAAKQWSGNRGALLPDEMVKDTQSNIVVFDNAQNPPQDLTWGIRQVTAERCIPFPATEAYGKIHGGDQTHVDKVVYCIPGRAGDLIVNYEAYDIDYDYEADIYFNGQKAGDVAITSDMKWSSKRTLTLKDALVNNTGINLLIFVNTKNPPNAWFWGVRNVSVASASATVATTDSKQRDDLAATATAAQPVDFHLAQNFPNPFNPSTTIRFALPQAVQVKLSIYNVRGELVRELVDGEMTVGNHEVEFNAGGMASGTYFYRLKAGTFIATKEMILTK